MTRRKEWAVERRSDPEGRQVHCLTADEGHKWIYALDDLHPAVRQRFASSDFNLCPACVKIEAKTVAKRLNRELTVGVFFAVIEQIEQELRAADSSQEKKHGKD
jgi:hypothetical protein